MAGFLAFFIGQFIAQIALPLIFVLMSRRVQPPRSETHDIYFRVRPPVSLSDIEIHRRMLNGPQHSSALVGNKQSGWVRGSPTKEIAQQFCANFKELVQRERWVLDQCDVF